MTTEDARPTDPAVPPAPAAAIFRAVPLIALVAVGFVALGTSSIAFLAGWWWLFFLIPLALAWYVVRTGTIVDAGGLRARTAWGGRFLRWDEVATLRLAGRGWIRAVRADGAGREVPLPGVRLRDLGRLGAASGGRIRVPTPAEAEAAAEHERELAATRMKIERLREQQAGERRGEDTERPDA